MLRTIVTHGLVAGLIVGIPMLLTAVLMKGLPSGPWGMVVAYLTMLLAFSTVFVAIKRQRDDQGGGAIRFVPALGLGLGISFVASIIYVLSWELALAATGMDFAGDYAKAAVKQLQARGATAEAVAKLSAEMDAFKQQYARPSFRIPVTFSEVFPVGVLVSLISAALLRNPRFLPARKS